MVTEALEVTIYKLKFNTKDYRFRGKKMAKRNNDNQSIQDLLKEFVSTNNLESGLDKVNVREAWTNLMGNGVNNYTTAIELKRETLYVKLSSSVLREELSYGKEKIIAMLNEAIGKQVITNLVLR